MGTLSSITAAQTLSYLFTSGSRGYSGKTKPRKTDTVRTNLSLKLYPHRASSGSGSGKVSLECIVTLQNRSQIHSQASSSKVPLECIVMLQNGSQIHSQASSSKVPLECIVMLQNGSQIHSQASTKASKLQICRSTLDARRSVCLYPEGLDLTWWAVVHGYCYVTITVY